MRSAFIILPVLMLSIAACKKNNDVSSTAANNNSNNNSNNINNNNNSTSTDSTMLATYFEIDTTITSGPDTLNKSEYSYDNNKRVVALKIYFFNSSQPAGGLKCTNYFFYNGNDTLPTLRIDDYSGAGNPYVHRDSVFLFYDATGRLVLDSVVQHYPSNPTQPRVISYKYAYSFNPGSGMYAVDIVRTYYYAGPQISQDHSDYSFDGNGNLEISLAQNAQFVYPHQYSFSYDSHPNPFHIKGCRDHSPFYDFGASGMPFLYDYYGMSFSLASTSNYNITTVNDSYTNGAGIYNDEYSYDHTYRSDGYPTSVTFYINNAGTPVYQKKGFYYYNH